MALRSPQPWGSRYQSIGRAKARVRMPVESNTESFSTSSGATSESTSSAFARTSDCGTRFAGTLVPSASMWGTRRGRRAQRLTGPTPGPPRTMVMPEGKLIRRVEHAGHDHGHGHADGHAHAAELSRQNR